MTRGIQLKQLSAADLGHLGLPLDLLEAELAAGEVERASFDPETPAQIPEPRLIAREVRLCLEQTLMLLTAALPAERRVHRRGKRALVHDGGERATALPTPGAPNSLV